MGCGFSRNPYLEDHAQRTPDRRRQLRGSASSEKKGLPLNNGVIVEGDAYSVNSSLLKGDPGEKRTFGGRPDLDLGSRSTTSSSYDVPLRAPQLPEDDERRSFAICSSPSRTSYDPSSVRTSFDFWAKQVSELLGEIANLDGVYSQRLIEALSMCKEQLQTHFVSLAVMAPSRSSYTLWFSESSAGTRMQPQGPRTLPCAHTSIGRCAVTGAALHSAASPADEWPADWKLLAEQHSLQVLLCAPLQSAQGIVGWLTFGSQNGPHSLFGMEAHIKILSAMLTHLLEMAHCQQAVGLMEEIVDVLNITDLAALLSRKVPHAVSLGCRLQPADMQVRIAWLSESRHSMLMMSQTAPDSNKLAPSKKGGQKVTWSNVSFQGSLLATAVRHYGAIVLPDCSTYLRKHRSSEADVLLSPGSERPAGALLVIPMTAAECAFGAIYVTVPSQGVFDIALKNGLCGLVLQLAPQVHHKLFQELSSEWGRFWSGEANVLTAASTAPATTEGTAASGKPVTQQHFRRSCDIPLPDTSQLVQHAPSLPTPQQLADRGHSAPNRLQPDAAHVKKRPAPLPQKASRTNLLMSMLQTDIRKRIQERGYMGIAKPSDLKLLKPLGSGCFGDVFQGIWQELYVVAVKVVQQKGQESETVKEAVEMALLTSLNHPSIVRVLAVFTEVLPFQEAMMDTSGRLVQTLRFKQSFDSAAAQGEEDLEDDAPPSLFNIIVMEYCDMGSLSDVVLKGFFHRPGGEVDMHRVLLTLLELAQALKYLHHLSVLHCDLKPGNVLLKSDTSDIRGFTTKLTDFGLSQFLLDDEVGANFNGWGTMAFAAPELLNGKGRLTSASDIYAFGILMWYMYAGKNVYDGMNAKQVRAQVASGSLRPQFPDNAPKLYSSLAQRCWHQDVLERPRVEEVCHALSAMMDIPCPCGRSGSSRRSLSSTMMKAILAESTPASSGSAAKAGEEQAELSSVAASGH